MIFRNRTAHRRCAGENHMLGRRKFLGTLTAGMAASMVPAGALTAAGLATLREQFAAQVHQDFALTDAAGVTVSARLVKLDDGPEHSGIDQFSIVFEGHELTEGVYQVHHATIGKVEVGLIDSHGAGRQRAYFSTFS
jgi:hypothetical protein